MNKLNVNLENCYGISKLNTEFDFTNSTVKIIYASNGCMKTSFAKTFRDFANNVKPKDEIDPDKTPVCSLIDENGAEISKNIFVIDSYNESYSSREKMNTLLVQEDLKIEYTKILKSIEEKKTELFKEIKRLSGSSNSEKEILETFNEKNIFEAILKINESARNVFKLLENLLQWSKLQTGGLEFNPVKFDLYIVVLETINLLGPNAAQKGIKLVNEMNKETNVVGDSNMVSSVVQNLISNAIKFSNADGVIKISQEEDEDYFYTKVEDSGIGMNNKDLLKLFRIDTHHTTLGTANEKGSGLGLVLCKELIEQNGGVITVKSEFGKGTTFIFSLPKFKKL